MGQCTARSEFGDPCAGSADHRGSHNTKPDATGNCLAWGMKIDPDAVTVPCPHLCGMAATVRPGDLRGIVHNEDGSHTLTQPDGETMTMHIAVEDAPKLRAV